MDLEQLRDQASAAVHKLTKEQLLETSKYLKCISESDETAKSKTRRFLIKKMEELLDAVEEEQDQEEACQFVKDLLDFVEKLPAEGTSKSNAGELRQLEELKKQYLQMQKAQAEVKEAIEKEIKTLSEKLVQVNANMAQHDTRAKQEQQAQIEPDEHMGPATPLEEKGKKKRTYERGAESDTREMFIMAIGLWTLLDPLAVFVVDAILGNSVAIV
ncbi:hypothetical protein EOD39_15341 [Acipenser ruthenus]|uniref:Uncharacterized protein n=1 Tax=Acipenser ruthenus TaxID=7906 RepID=A0A662YLK3_ACIRT|nr:hypothetical protein EOD39_15341 [Acipenser ruthenus]